MKLEIETVFNESEARLKARVARLISRGHTQKEIAALAGVPQGFLSDWLRRDRATTLDKLDALLEAVRQLEGRKAA